jgi:hypothetical protein
LFVKFIIGRLDFNNNYIYVSLIVFAFSIIGVSLYPLRRMLKDQSIRLILLWLFVPVIFTFFVSFKLPMFQPFRLLFCLPAFLLLVAVGMNSFKNGKKYIFGLVFFLLIFCQSIFWFQPVFWREDWRSAVYEADQFIENGGTVLFAWSTPFPPYEFYSQDKKGYGVVLKNPGSYEEIHTMMSNKNLGNTIVLFDYLSELTDPQNNIKMQLESRNYKLVETKDYGGVGLVHYYR